MEAIARRARASKETLYAWFENKETLLNTLIASRIEAMASRVVPAAEKDPSPANVLPIIAEDTLRFMLAMAPLSDAMGPGEPGDRASRMIGRTIGEERKKFVDYILRCREHATSRSTTIRSRLFRCSSRWRRANGACGSARECSTS
jgi:AcrR family transcriptional regulator